MTDDSASQNLPQDNQTIPASSPDQLQSPPEATPSSSIGQQPSEWPDSTNLANDQPVTSTPPPVTIEEKPVEAPAVPEPPKEETPSQAISSEVGQVLDSPISPNLANDQSESTSSSNLVNPPDLPNETSTIQSQPPLPEEKPPEQPIPSETSPLQVGQSEPSESTSTSDLSNPSYLDNIPPINVSPPDIQPISDQSEAPNDTSPNDSQKQEDQLANFKPEPPEQPQEAPLANLSVETLVKEDNNSQNSSKKSFGDLLSGNTNQPASSQSASPFPDLSNVSNPSDLSSQPMAPSSSPTTSFGDLIKDIEITPPSIPEAERPIEQSSQNQQSPPIQPPQSPSFPQSPTSTSVNIDEKLNEGLVLRRQKANQVRQQKKENHLHKIMELVRNTKTITNTDIQRLLHVSQSTATNYLAELSHRGMLKREGIRGGAKYTL